MSTPTAEQVIAGVTRSVESVLTIHGDDYVFADIGDIRAAIEAGVALAFAGLIVTERQDR